MILRAAEAENREENNRQQNQPNPEADAFAETLGYIDEQNDRDDEVDERDEHQDYPPTRPARDLAHEVSVHDWDNGGPAGLPGSAEKLGVADCVADCIRLAIPQATKWTAHRKLDRLRVYLCAVELDKRVEKSLMT